MRDRSPRTLQPARSRRAGLSALALVAVLGAFAACASKPKPTLEQRSDAEMQAFKAQIRKTVTDPSRADRLVVAVDECERIVRQAASMAQDYRIKLQTLDADYSATRAEYAALFRQHDTQRAALIQQALALRGQITTLTTNSEWQQLKQARLTALEELLETVSTP